MKTLKEKIEVMQAALDGEEIQALWLQEGNEDWLPEDLRVFNWACFDYRIKPKPLEWYENIPDGGVLCWMDYRDGERAAQPRLVLSEGFYKNRGSTNYTPLTKQEIQVFMDNSPK